MGEREAYLQGFAAGLQFALLAVEGRLRRFPREQRDRVLQILREYHFLGTRVRERLVEAPAPRRNGRN